MPSSSLLVTSFPLLPRFSWPEAWPSPACSRQGPSGRPESHLCADPVHPVDKVICLLSGPTTWRMYMLVAQILAAAGLVLVATVSLLSSRGCDWPGVRAGFLMGVSITLLTADIVCLAERLFQ